MGKIKQAVIMVGGQGTRLRPLTDTKPKPILPVLDKPCLHYLMKSMADAGIEEVFLACGYKSEQLVEAIGNGMDLGITVEYSYEDEPLGTAGALKLLESRLDDTFVVANGDTFADIDIGAEMKEHTSSGAFVTLALTTVSNPSEFGIVRLDDDGRISEFKEKPKPEEAFSNLVNAGVYVMEKTVLAHIPPTGFFDLSKNLFKILMDRGDRLQGYNLQGVWHDVGRPSDLLETNLLMAERENQELPSGDNMKTERPFYIGPKSDVSNSNIKSVSILSGNQISNSTIERSLIMRGCKISGATIKESILGDGCVVKEGAVIENSVLGDGTVVESGATINDTRE